MSEPIEPIRQEEIVEVRRNFAEPIGAAETIARYMGKLVAALCAELEMRGLGARRLDLLFSRVDNRIEAIRIGTAMPVRDTKRLTRLLTDKIETIDPGFGIELIRLPPVIRRSRA
jgi:protein ImuB